MVTVDNSIVTTSKDEEAAGLRSGPSMSHRDHCHHNALPESLFGSLKKERTESAAALPGRNPSWMCSIASRVFKRELADAAISAC
ncbi:MAG: hypothetical protein WBX11_09040 [Thiobacillaceae bacterium]|jgi:hypothetical protein